MIVVKGHASDSFVVEIDFEFDKIVATDLVGYNFDSPLDMTVAKGLEFDSSVQEIDFDFDMIAEKVLFVAETVGSSQGNFAEMVLCSFQIVVDSYLPNSAYLNLEVC